MNSKDNEKKPQNAGTENQHPIDSKGIEDNDDFEAQMAESMAIKGFTETGDDDLETQMAASLEAEEDADLEKQLTGEMSGDMADILGEGLLDDLGDEDESSVSVKPLEFSQLRPSDEDVDRDNIDRLLDVTLNISVELGHKQMQIKEILELGPGKIIELDKLAGEPVDLLINGKLLAKGEVVVVDENFGVRITDLINPKDRIRSLR